MKIAIIEEPPFTVDQAVLRQIQGCESEGDSHSRIDLILVNGAKKFTGKVVFSCRYYDEDDSFCGVDTPWWHLHKCIAPNDSVDVVLSVNTPENASRVDVRISCNTKLMDQQITDLPFWLYFAGVFIFGFGLVIGKFFE